MIAGTIEAELSGKPFTQKTSQPSQNSFGYLLPCVTLVGDR